MNETNNNDVVKIAKIVSIVLASAAVIMFLALSVVIYRFSERNPILYEHNYGNLSSVGQSVATGMKETGRFESDIASSLTRKKNPGYKFFEDVSRRHQK